MVPTELDRVEYSVRCEVRLQVAPARYPVPDVTVIDRSRPIEQIVTHPPVAVFEILAPEDRLSRMLVKLSDYEKMGVRTIRVIDPATQTIYRYEQSKLEPVRDTVEGLQGHAKGNLDWDAIQALLD